MRTIIFVGLFGVLTVFSLLLPTDAFAQIVPCNGPDCQTCHFVQLGSNILNWIIGIMTSVCAIIIIVAGFKMVMAAGNPGGISEAKGLITNAIVGFVILLAAWLIVDTVLRVLVNGSNTGTGAAQIPMFGPWNQIQCVAQPTVSTQQPPTTPPTTPPPTAICNDDAALMAQYRGSPVGAVDPGLNTLISCYMGDANVAAAVDGGQIYTVDRSHPRCALTNGNTACGPCSHSANSCHYGRGSGQGARAVDFNARSGFTEAQLYQRIQARRAQCGGTIINEGDHTHISMSNC